MAGCEWGFMEASIVARPMAANPHSSHQLLGTLRPVLAQSVCLGIEEGVWVWVLVGGGGWFSCKNEGNGEWGWGGWGVWGASKSMRTRLSKLPFIRRIPAPKVVIDKFSPLVTHHRDKLAFPRPLSKPPPKTRSFMAWGCSSRKNQKNLRSKATIKLAQPFPALELQVGKVWT